MASITKAVIPAGGWGTRRLPITKVIEKSMLPIGNRPLVDYVVSDCLAAGIRDIFFVVSSENSQLRQYYSENKPLNEYLRTNGKADMLPLVTPPDDARFHYIVQEIGPTGKYGTAVPVSMMMPYVKPGESLAVLMGDDFIYHSDGSGETARLIGAASTGGSAMLGVEVPREYVGRYGVLELNEKDEFIRIVEKPSPDQAPSTLINISKYVLNYEALKCVKRYVDADQAGEYLITDPLNGYVAQGGVLKVVRAAGEYLDGGTLEGWFQANRTVLGL